MKFLPLAISLSLASLLHADPPSVQTTLPTYKNHHPALLADKDPKTMFWAARNVRKNDIISVTWPTEIPRGSYLTLLDGLTKGGDHFDGAVLEASMDGKEWRPLGSRRCGVLSAHLSRPLKYFRLRATRDLPHWVALRELAVESNAPLHLSKGRTELNGQQIHFTLACDLREFPDLIPAFERMSETYFTAWPRLVELLGSPLNDTIRDVDIKFVPDMDHPAHASGNTIVISAAHLRRDPEDTKGVFIHELTHVIQHYPVGQPSWFIEGSADYTRYLLNPDDAWARRNRKHIPYDKPFGHYWASAAFLFHLEDTYKKPIVLPVSQALRNKSYNDTIWKTLTGKDLPQLAADYKVSGWKPADRQ